jgi:hypothetical protein
VHVPRGRGCQLDALVSEVSHRNLDRNPTPSRVYFHWRCIIKHKPSAAYLTANVKRKTATRINNSTRLDLRVPMLSGVIGTWEIREAENHPAAGKRLTLLLF